MERTDLIKELKKYPEYARPIKFKLFTTKDLNTFLNQCISIFGVK